MAASPLRILHVVPYYEQAWAYGGIPRLAATMTRALARRGHHVAVYTTDVRDAWSRVSSRPYTCDGVDVRMFPNLSNTVAYHLQFFTPVGLRWCLRKAATTFDIAHLHACHNLPGVIAASELLRAGVPYVVSPNGTALPIERRVAAKRLFALTLGRQMIEKAARVVAVSKTEADQLAALGIAPRTIARIPNPIDERQLDCTPDGARFRAAFGLGQRPVLLFLGKLTPRKGVVDLVNAFAALARPDATLVIAGNDMGAGHAIDAVVRQLRLERRVLRPGLLTGAGRLDALAAADVVAYPSRDEIFGLVPLEALLCGTPVVVCNDSGCGEVVGATGGGLLVPPGHPEALAAALGTILDDQSIWRQRASSGGDAARRLFGADVVCRQLERLYAGVLTEHRTGQRMRA
jgi:glycosyltransferase involved in cell wall biosynthesis